ncbi:MAG TPA: glycosyltransferase [Myxococcota bacterium]|nr:glycosyltransferase [Myxococcota bacterium]
MSALPPITIAVEWDNATDVEPRWVERHLNALQGELLRCHARFAALPIVAMLHDPERVSEHSIRARIAQHAPKLADVARVELRALPGADYCGLKTAGIAAAETELVVLVDSDTAPQPGWLDALLAPFADPEVVAVAGFTTIAFHDLASRVCALAWVYHLPSEAGAPLWKNAMHTNNLALRRDYFRAHPWRWPHGGKKGGAQFLRDVEANGKRWVRAPNARLLHAPHRSAFQFALRGWTAGVDQDWSARKKVGDARAARAAYALRHFARNARRALARVVTKRREVGLPAWQLPAALGLALAHWSATLARQLACAVRR